MVENIEPFGGMNKIQDEMKQYVVDDDVKEINNKGIEAFQNAVGDLLFWNAAGDPLSLSN